MKKSSLDYNKTLKANVYYQPLVCADAVLSLIINATLLKQYLRSTLPLSRGGKGGGGGGGGE